MKIEDKILEGYIYRNKPIESNDPNEKSINMHTGSGGAKDLIKVYKDEGIEDKLIETLIEVYIHAVGWQPISNLNIKKL